MRFRSIAVVTLLSLAVAGSARAQGAAVDPQCSAGSTPTAARDACQQAVDLFKYMVPQLGIGVTGGNFTLGQGGSLGGLGHFSIGIRGNLLAGHVPDIQTPSLAGPQQRSSYPVNTQFLGLPAVDASIGIFKGLPLALTNVGGIDLLLSAIYIPTVEGDEVSVTPESNLKLGYGVRVGILQESLLMPGIGVSYMVRDLPVTDIVGTLPGATTTTLTVDDFDMKTTSWRVTASKSLVLFTIGAGVGQDTYDASASVSATANGQNAGPFTVELPKKLTRTNYFGDVSINLLVLKLIGEIGMVSGGDIPTYNTFATEADASRVYGSVGIRFGF